MTEKQLLAWVKKVAKLYGYRVYHTLWSIGSDPGFPDLVLCRPPRVIVAELKGPRGKLTEHQADWLQAFGDCRVEWYVWTPADQDEILEALRD